MFSLIYTWTNCWANNRGAGDLRRHRTHYDVTVIFPRISFQSFHLIWFHPQTHFIPLTDSLIHILPSIYPSIYPSIHREHDTNDDNHLDGLELMNSILHVFAHSAHANNMVANIQATIDRVASKYQTWWRHQMETFSALLALCAGNSPVTGFTQRPVARSFDVFFDLCLNKRLSKQSLGWWFETPSGSFIWRYCNDKGPFHYKDRLSN